MDMEIEDLFDFDEDLLQNICSQAETPEIYKEQQEMKNDLSLILNCTGDNKDAGSDRNEAFYQDLESLLRDHMQPLSSNFDVFDWSFDGGLLNSPENIDLLTSFARMNIQKLSLSLLDISDHRIHKTFYSLREQVTQFMLILRAYYQDLSNDQLGLIRLSLGTFDSIPNFQMIHASFSQDGNSSLSASYHLLHGSLEWRWIYLTTVFKIELSQGVLGNDDSEVKCELILLMHDLLSLAIAKYQKCNNATIMFSTPFICGCVKDMWCLLYQFVLLKLQNEEFWTLLSSAFNDIKNGKNPHANFASKKSLLRSSSNISCKNSDQFSIWMLCGFLKVVKISSEPENGQESYELLENLVKNYMKVEQSEENMRILMLLISEVIAECYLPKSEILMHLWETFQRKINSPFFIAGQSPNMIAVASTSGGGFLEQIKTQLNVSIIKMNPNTTSYKMFVHLLSKIVQRFTDGGQRVQVQKVLGRIYSKFPSSKLIILNEMGVLNLTHLFLSLAISTHFQDVAQKMTNTLLEIPIDKVSHQQQVLMKGHVAMLILYRENQMNLTQYLTKLMTQVNSLSERANNSIPSILKILADGLQQIVLRNSDDELFESGEDLLLDIWIVKYLTCGTVSEQDRVYESLTKIIQKISNDHKRSGAFESEHVKLTIQKLFKIFLPHLKQVFSKSESIWLPEMTAHLCMLAADHPQIDHMSLDMPKFDILVKTFVDMNCICVQNSIKLLTVILKNNEKIHLLERTMLMQHWIKCSVLMNGSNTELKEFTRAIMQTDDFTSMSQTAMSQHDEFLNAKEPLCTFLIDLGKKYATASKQEKFQLIDKVYEYFSSFEKWSLPLLQQTTAGQKQSSSVSADESVMRIYTFISLTILHCAEIIYIRSKSLCFFNVAMSHFILPASLMMGHNQPRCIIVSMYKVWPLLIEGISRLDFKHDPHVAKVLNDVIIKWAPLLKISNNSKAVARPFVNVTNMRNADVVELVWAKLGKSFVALQNRKPSEHSCMILTIIEEVMHLIEADERRLLLMWKSLMVNVTETAMMTEENVPSGMQCFSLLERFIKNKHFDTSRDMKQLVLGSLKSLTQTHLSYYSAFYFRFMTKVAKVKGSLVRELSTELMSQIQKVEQLRGSGRDVKLRNSYDSLQTVINRK